ncbi:MAG: SUMF1/EgtB/PvdO family nonheme iron enzyme [Cytophagales bacterium]|nr:SUMF1/EgtB/PvdO family nonheme iron enzyme [Cytophagales bacterium]
MIPHKVKVDGFWMDETEVTNKQFRKFVEETKYITVAERVLDWGGNEKTGATGYT